MNIQSGLPVDRSIRLLVGRLVWLHMGSFSSPPPNSEESLLVRLFLTFRSGCEASKSNDLCVREISTEMRRYGRGSPCAGRGA
jgi:hypothetical protein